ncbi:MAG TPA: hypothetical protein VFT56_05995 [Sphingomonas sp.]|nr:hypothetical protein [Sphingomonas sp.]
MSRGPDAGTRLARALERGGPNVVVTARASTRWASVTFTGARHALTLDAPASVAFDAWVEGLPETAFVLPGHLLADLAVLEVRRDGARVQVRIEALTVEE